MSETNVTPLREFNETVRLWGKKWDLAKHHHQKAASARVEAGKILLELRERVDAGEKGELATWWEWFEDNRMLFQNITRRTAEELLQIARADDPETKLLEIREQTRQRVEKHRALRNAETPKPQLSIVTSSPQFDVPAEPDETVKRIPKPERMPTKYTTGPDDDLLVGQMVDIFKRMSWDARVRVVKELTALYRKWHEEGE